MEKLNFVGPQLSSIIPMPLLVGSVAIFFAALSAARGHMGFPGPVFQPVTVGGVERRRRLIGCAGTRCQPVQARVEGCKLGGAGGLIPQYRLSGQVAMGALLKAPARPGQRSSPADRNAFSQKIVDFVVQDPTTGKIVALIEVDDWSHSAARNRIRDAMTAGAGYRTFRIPASARPTIPAVLRIVGPLREETVQIAFEG